MEFLAEFDAEVLEYLFASRGGKRLFVVTAVVAGAVLVFLLAT